MIEYVFDVKISLYYITLIKCGFFVALYSQWSESSHTAMSVMSLQNVRYGCIPHILTNDGLLVFSNVVDVVEYIIREQYFLYYYYPYIYIFDCYKFII